MTENYQNTLTSDHWSHSSIAKSIQQQGVGIIVINTNTDKQQTNLMFLSKYYQVRQLSTIFYSTQKN